MATKAQLEILEDSLLLTFVKDNGEEITVDVAKDLDPRDVANGLNTAPTMIGLLEVWAVTKEEELENLKAELDAWVAEQDGIVRNTRGFAKGEAKITQAIRRKSHWLDQRYTINAAKKEVETIRGILRSYYAKLDVVRTKDSTYRKHGELSSTMEQYGKRRNFNISEKRKGDADMVKGKIKKTKKKGVKKRRAAV